MIFLKIVSLFLDLFKIYDDFNYFKAMNFTQIVEIIVILKIINTFKNCHGKFTANYQSSFQFIKLNLASTFLKIRKIQDICYL